MIIAAYYHGSLINTAAYFIMYQYVHCPVNAYKPHIATLYPYWYISLPAPIKALYKPYMSFDDKIRILYFCVELLLILQRVQLVQNFVELSLVLLHV